MNATAAIKTQGVTDHRFEIVASPSPYPPSGDKRRPFWRRRPTATTKTEEFVATRTVEVRYQRHRYKGGKINCETDIGNSLGLFFYNNNNNSLLLEART